MTVSSQSNDTPLVVGISVVVAAGISLAWVSAGASSGSVYWTVLLAVCVVGAPLALRPSRLAAGAVISFLFTPSLVSVTSLEILGYLDEALLVIFLSASVASRLSKGLQLRLLPGSAMIGGFIVLGVISSMVNLVPVEVSAISLLLALKGWLLAFGIAQLDWDNEMLNAAIRLSAFLMTIAVLAIVANLALGERWASIFDATAENRFGITVAQGLFSVPLAAGNVMACSAILILSHGLVYGQSRLHIFLLAGTSLGAFFTGRRTAVVGLAAAGVLLVAKHRAVGTLLAVILGLGIVGTLGASLILDALESAFNVYVDRDDAARTVLHRDMWAVAASTFPLGAGFGRFGSFMAGASYSPIYEALGYTAIWGLHESTGNSSFLTDTQWPMLVAEPGFIGGAFAVLALVSVLRFAWGLTSSTEPQEKWLALAVVGMMAVLLVASIALPAFFGSSPPQALFFAALGALVARRAARSADEPRGSIPRSKRPTRG